MNWELLKPVGAGVACGNCRVLVGPHGEVLEALWASRPVFRVSGFEPVEKAQRGPCAGGGGDDGRAMRRARKNLRLLSLCNRFDTFLTLTLNPDEIDRHDIKAVTKRLNVWLDNRVRRKGLRYVLVPELHKDGAIHFHGLVNGEALKLKPSGHYDKAGREIFNVTDWKLGFTTAVKLDENYERAVNYVGKYITKQTGEGKGPIGGRWYYHGGDLAQPKAVVGWVDSRPDGRPFKVDEAGLELVYWGD